MPGQVPLSNAKFVNSPDFNNQAISGITGSGVFREFAYNNVGGTARTLSSADLWGMLQLSGNCLVTIPAGISADIGDEILVINTTGTISFTTSGGATLLSSQFYSIPAERPARLVYAGSNNWILAGAKTSYDLNNATNCCSTSVSPVYTFGDWPQGPAYSNQYGTALYTFSGLGGSVVLGGTGYTISSGVISESPCTTVSFTTEYTFYDGVGSPSNFYTYLSINILNNSEVLGVPFKTVSTSDVYACDNSSAVGAGTYYRYSDVYGVSYPVCFNSDGIVIATSAC